ncbi:putative membrane protein [Xanthomonas euvesicatoria pv. vesicatoria str. 85-10]|nr:putative membrane protein [Xanthomonas euvesicatoria pv. vesicatoria str. 85-10]
MADRRRARRNPACHRSNALVHRRVGHRRDTPQTRTPAGGHMTLFFALCFVGVAVAGLTALLIFWPLTLVHMRDRHPEALASFGDPAFISPVALRWLLARRYRSYRDTALSGLATPAWLSLLTIFFGLGMAALLGLLSKVMQ